MAIIISKVLQDSPFNGEVMHFEYVTMKGGLSCLFLLIKNVSFYHESLSWCAYSGCSLLFTTQFFLQFEEWLLTSNCVSLITKAICITSFTWKRIESRSLHRFYRNNFTSDYRWIVTYCALFLLCTVCFCSSFYCTFTCFHVFEKPVLSKSLFLAWALVIRSALWLKVTSWKTSFQSPIGTSVMKENNLCNFRCKLYQVCLNPHMMSLGRALSDR